MASTRKPGITIGIGGFRFIDKRHRGIRIGMRVGATSLALLCSAEMSCGEPWSI